MNDDMNSAIFTRNAHAIQLGNKAFNMSQPMLGAETEHSMMDNEDQSDVSPTACSSPTSGSQKQSDPVANALSNQPSQIAGLGIEITPRTSVPNGLPSIAQTVSPNQMEGLPSSGEPMWVGRSVIVPETHASPQPTASEVASARSVVATTSAKSGLTDSDSHTSSDVSLSYSLSRCRFSSKGLHVGISRCNGVLVWQITVRTCLSSQKWHKHRTFNIGIYRSCGRLARISEAARLEPSTSADFPKSYVLATTNYTVSSISSSTTS